MVRKHELTKSASLSPVGLMDAIPACIVSTACSISSPAVPPVWSFLEEGRRCRAGDAIEQTKTAVPALALAPKVVKVGNCPGRDVEKFEKFGLRPAPAERVAPPLVAECFANLECKVADTRLVNRYNLFVVEVLKAWIDPAQKHPKTIHHHGYGRFAVDGEMIKLKSRMR
jgi:flavin reductase (DIM6/NTAB) family NADH-FMN oxidoreductase RutF